MDPSASLEPIYKQQFAQFLFAGHNPIMAAVKIWTAVEQRPYALMIAEQWKDDPYVLNCVDQLRKAAETGDKPRDKQEYIKWLEDEIETMSDDNKLKGMRLLAEVQGYIVKAEPSSIVNKTKNNILVNVAPTFNKDEWEAFARDQQAKLQERSKLIEATIIQEQELVDT